MQTVFFILLSLAFIALLMLMLLWPAILLLVVLAFAGIVAVGSIFVHLSYVLWWLSGVLSVKWRDYRGTKAPPGPYVVLDLSKGDEDWPPYSTYVDGPAPDYVVRRSFVTPMAPLQRPIVLPRSL